MDVINLPCIDRACFGACQRSGGQRRPMPFRGAAGDRECWATPGEPTGLRTARGTPGTSLPAPRGVQLAKGFTAHTHPPSCSLTPQWDLGPPHLMLHPPPL